MRFYKDIIAEMDESRGNSANRYHEWSQQSISRYWDISTNNPFIRRQFYPMEYWEDLLAWAARKIETTPTTIVDIGCGNGNLIECIRKVYKNATIYGVDLSEESLGLARERFSKDRNIRFQVGSLDRLPFEDGSIDLVTCTEVLEHTFPKTFGDSFSEVRRVLKTYGYYLASLPFNEKIAFVCCPECSSVFTPYQHMLFEVSHDDIREILSKNNLKLIETYQSLDRSQPSNRVKRILKSVTIKWSPNIATRFFPKAGVSGFLARATKSL